MLTARLRTRTGLMVLAAVAVTVLVWQHVQATRLGYEVERARERCRRLREDILSGELEWEKTVAPAQLARHARIRLGMSPARPESIRILEDAENASDAPWTTPSRPFARGARALVDAVGRTLVKADALASRLRT